MRGLPKPVIIGLWIAIGITVILNLTPDIITSLHRIGEAL